MLTFGDADGPLWRVEVVLRGGDDAVQASLLDRLRAAATGSPSRHDDVRETHSYDIDPPEGSVGAALWVRAGTVGAAADEGVRVVTAAVDAPLELWDVRVIPRAAITLP